MAAKYTDEQKAEAVAVYAAEGMAAAHHQTGVPKGTIKGWADAANQSAPERSDEQTRAATAAHVAQMTERRQSIRTDLADTVTVLLNRIRDDDCTASHGQAHAISVGILVDKLSVTGWGDAVAAETGGNADLERMREEARKRGRALVGVPA